MHTYIHAYMHPHASLPASAGGIGHTDTASGSVSTLQPHRRTLKDSTNKLKISMTVMHDGNSDNDRDDRNNDGGGDEKDDDSNDDDGNYEHHDDDADDDSTFEVVSPMRYTNPCLQTSWFNPGFVLLFSTNVYPPPGAPAPF